MKISKYPLQSSKPVEKIEDCEKVQNRRQTSATEWNRIAYLLLDIVSMVQGLFN